ncbi:hypothetical protein F5878DRAFT_544885 [Lentinula raphanica]|uniref:DNA breaking-rejoining enzyme n=1 Tax=Lentinula raphanica TaxID=153919 RepID=A0AA38U901_9AGAR|nr:hypothetical protein F5878DRAFT_544885 [Lentinula raphanica]
MSIVLATASHHHHPPNRSLLPSQLRPSCSARDRLTLWKPINERVLRDSEGNELALPKELGDRIEKVLAAAFAESTLETYAAGLLAFHVFCDSRGVEESQRAPCSVDLLQSWIATMAGNYAGTSIKNYLHGVRAWHIMHGIEWNIDKPTLDTIIRGAERLQPDRLKRKKRQPFTIEYITKILDDFDPQNQLDAACGGCLTTSFYCAARVGELTVPTLKDFTPDRFVTPSQIRTATDRNGFQTTVIHVPRTKSSPVEGEDLYFSQQLGQADPDWWLRNHLEINKPESTEHLFAYGQTIGRHENIFPDGRRALTKSAFIQRIYKAARNKNLPLLQGHGIRIGATLEYLLRGVPFDAVRVIGRWQSDAFLLYLRKHAEIMAPYLQPELHQAFIQYTMPPVRCKCPPTYWGSAVAGCVAHSFLLGIAADRVLRRILSWDPRAYCPPTQSHHSTDVK